VTQAQTAQRNGAVGFAAVVGAVAGASLAAHRGRRSAGIGAIAGAAGWRVRRRWPGLGSVPNEIPPLWQRIAMTGALVAPLAGRPDGRVGAGR